MNRKAEPAVLADSHSAVHDYLAELLREVPEYSPTQQQVPGAERVSPAPLEPPPEMGATADAPVVTAPAEAVGSGSPKAGEVPPPWARARFQALLFHIGRLKLAVPLVQLAGVIPYREPTPLPNHSELFLGLIQHLEHKVKVVDVARLALAGREQVGSLPPPAERCRNIVLIDGGQWGLACDSIGEVLALEPEEVRWRATPGRRPWLAGTVLEHLCAIVNVDELARMLEGKGKDPEMPAD